MATKHVRHKWSFPFHNGNSGANETSCDIDLASACLGIPRFRDEGQAEVSGMWLSG